MSEKENERGCERGAGESIRQRERERKRRIVKDRENERE